MARLEMTAVARLVSILGHPFAVVLVMVAAAAVHFEPPAEAAKTVALVAALALLPVAFLMVRQVRRGAWAHVDASNPRERSILFVVGITGVVLLLAYALAFHPGSYQVRGAFGAVAVLGLCAVASRWLKVSLHMAFNALAATSLLLLGSPAAWALLALMPILAWSRLHLGRHVPAEVIAGTIIGVGLGLAIHSL
jgi:membrane-associated phospholipid phosphatase